MPKISTVDSKHCFFSIIIASFNCIEEIQECIGTINSQTFRSYEILISDGGSFDGTASFINSKNIRNLIWSKSGSDTGIYSALNAALPNINGDWVIVLGADDKFHDENSLRSAAEQIANCKEHALLFYSDIFIRQKSSLRMKKYPEFNRFCSIYSGAPFIHHQSAFISRDAFFSVGFFDESFRIHADYDLILRVLRVGAARKIHGAFVEYNASGYSSKFRNIWRSICEVFQIRAKNGHPPFNLRLVMIYVRQVLRGFIIFDR